MNDADLEKLAIKPGKLEPIFNRSVTNYSTILQSTVTKISVNPLTRDAGASWTVVGHGCVRTLPVTPGEEKTIIIEVSAEDGSTKQYSIRITSLSPSDIALSDIKLSIGILTPAFKIGIYEYSAELPWYAENVRILAEAKDHDVGGANVPFIVDLDYGPTFTQFDVTAPDKSHSKTLKLKFIKDKILRTTNNVNRELNNGVYCPLCLGILHCPVSLQTENRYKANLLYCRQCIESLIRTRKTDPFDEVPLQFDCIKEEKNHVKDLSGVFVTCCYSQLGCEEEVKLKELGSHMKNCAFQPVFASKFEGVVDKKLMHNDIKMDTEACKMCSHSVRRDEVPIHLRHYCPAKMPNTKINHVVQLRNWERKLQEIGAYEAAEIKEDDEKTLKLGKDIPAFEDLETAAKRYATLIKMHPRDFVNHMKLGLVFEEMYYAADIWGNKPEQKSGDHEEEEDRTLDNLMDMTSDSSKEDDIQALCEAKGIAKNAPLSLKLKAIDEEYHSLLEQNQSSKADYVQKLYAWKSKQSVDTNKPISSTSEDSYLGKALLKFEDACACSPNTWMVHMHVGRHYLMQGRYEDAIARLEAALGLKPISIEARFYLGLAYVKHFGKHNKQHSECAKYLQDGVDFILLKLFEEPEEDLSLCSAENFVRNSNVLLVEGMLELANLLKEKSSTCEKDKLRVIGMFRQTSLVCFHYINNMMHRNEIYHQLLWVILRVHFSLGVYMTTELKRQSDISTREKRDMQMYWERLASLGKAFELPTDNRTLSIQRKICEEAVSLCPSSSQSLFRLGDVQLMIYDQDPISNEAYLREAEFSYRASIEFEGKPAYSSEHSVLTSDCIWWKQKHIKSEGNHHKPPVKPVAASPMHTANAKKPTKSPVAATKGAAKPSKALPTKATVGAASKHTAAPAKIVAAPAKIVAAPSKTVAAPSKTVAAPSKGIAAPSKTVAAPSKGVAALSKGVAAPSKSAAALSKGVAAPSKSAAPTAKNIAAPTKVAAAPSKSVAAPPKSTAGSSDSAAKSNSSRKLSPRKTPDSLAAKKSDQTLPKFPGSHQAGCCAASKMPHIKEPNVPLKDQSKPVEKPVISEPEVPEFAILNTVSYQARLGLARILFNAHYDCNKEEVKDLYRNVIELAPYIHDAYIELGGILAKTDTLQAVDVYNKFPFGDELSFDDAYLHGEIVRILMNSGIYEDPNLERSMIAYGTVMGLSVLDKQVGELENKFKYKLLRNVYAGVNKKNVDDEELQEFFKFKCWV